jgi:predicted kinase
MNKKPFVILFAGAVGSSKSPIANYLSFNLDLPIFSRDTIRTEVVEDLGKLDSEEFEKRSANRLESILAKKISFIYDASIDRKWEASLRETARNVNYDTYIISIDLSKEFLLKLYEIKNYNESKAEVDRLLSDHDSFLKNYSEDVNLHITDEDFGNRLEIALKGVRKSLESR